MYKILIADDEEIFRRKIKRLPYFKDSDIFTIQYEVQNGLEALEIVKTEKVDLIITDIRMPVLDGIELLKEIKNKDLCSCVILLSNYSDFAYAKEGLIFGAFDYIVKPVDEKKISETLERAKQFLDKQGDNWAYSFREIELISQNIYHQEAYALEIAEGIFQTIVEKGRDSVGIKIQIYDALKSIVSEILKTRKYLEKLIDFDAICAPKETEDIKLEALHSLKIIAEEIRKFCIDTRSELVNNIGLYVLEHIESNVSLKVIAEKYFVNKDYISHIFKMETGKSFVDYVTMVKMEYAKKTLKETDAKVYEVAGQIGYKDTEYFSRIFKKYFGYNPSEVRRDCI